MKKPTLDDLLKLAGEQAKGVLLELHMRQLLPTWLFVLPDGKFSVLATPWNNDAEKILARIKVKRQIKKLGPVAYSLLTEAWTASYKPEEVPGTSRYRRPADRADRREVVMAVASDGTQIKYAQWAIKRDWNDQVAALEPIQMRDGKLESWMAQMLKDPD